MSKEFVTAFGLKDSSKHPGTVVCCMEYSCLMCNKKSHIEICPYSTRQLCEDMKDRPKPRSRKRRRKPVQKPKSKIMEREAKEAKKVLEESKTWHDTMLGFGMDDKAIEEYMQEGKDMDNKQV
ncbi:unnamed protein product [marine sediment metagenome]|uniref:Uncharacterized protein n=1 Tax=marine sediment metagenome TaxID=412755 RepID=X1AGN7_9ZZZZ